jgi:hypothetical protein
LAALVVGCGRDDSPKATATATSTASVAVATATTTRSGASATASVAASGFKAQDAVPDLTSLGYTVQQQGKDPAAGAVDVYRALFASKTAGHAAMTVLYNFPDVATAKTQYASLADALKNPPPDFVGSKATFVDTPSPAVGDAQKAYVTQAADSGGLKVWTDIYQIGHVVVIVQVLDSGATDQLPLRGQIASAVAAKVK